MSLIGLMNRGIAFKMEQINPLYSWIGWRIKRNKNVIIFISGPTGTGKSMAGLRAGADLSKIFGTPFTIEGNVDFNFPKLLEKMHRPENSKPGTVFVFEEPGAFGGGASSREWQSKANKFFTSFLQTSRHRNQILIMTCPSFSYLDAGARRLVHCYLEMQTINFRDKTSHVKPYILQVNSRTGKIYFKYLRFKNKEMAGKLKSVSFTLPQKELVEPYEKVKTQFTSKLNQSIIDESEPKTVDKRKKINKDIIRRQFDEGLDNHEIAKIWGCTLRAVQKHKKAYENGRKRTKS